MIRDKVIFDIAGALTTSAGQIANFLRGSKAYSEFTVDGGLALVEVSTHEPRFGNDGSLYLEPGATNYVRNPTDLGDPTVWVRGSNIGIATNVAPSMANTYEADRVTVTPGTGNVGRQTLRQDLLLPPGPNTFTFYLSLRGGSFGPNDVMRIAGDIEGGTATARLDQVYNARPRRYLPISITRNVIRGGQVSMQLYVENTVAFDFSGAMAGPGRFRTTFIDGLTSAPSRADEELVYERSPLEGLGTFTIYTHLLEWRGDGPIVQAGNFALGIEDGKLKAVLGGAEMVSPDPLPPSAKVAVRVSASDNRAKMYINSTYVATVVVTNYTGERARFDFTPKGVRRFKNFYVMDVALADGSPALGGTVSEEMAELFASEESMLRKTEGRGIISFPSIRIKPRARVAVRLPQTEYASGRIEEVTLGQNHTPQITVVEAVRILDPGIQQAEWISINGNPPIEVRVQNPTLERIAQALYEALLTQNLPIKVSLSETLPAIVLTSKSPGNKFTVAVSPNLTAETVQHAVPATNSLRVASPSDFRLGDARIIRNFTDIADIVITNINQLTGVIQFVTQPVRNAQYIRQGDILFQADWKTLIAPGNYIAGIHETHLEQVKLSDKAIDGFAFENHSNQELIITPFVRLVI